MESLVLDFENKVNDRNYSVTDLLRYCLIVATKLKQKEFIDWVNSELSGYKEVSNVPSYRKVPVSVKFLNPIYGWCSYIIADKEINEQLNKLPIKN